MITQEHESGYQAQAVPACYSRASLELPRRREEGKTPASLLFAPWAAEVTQDTGGCWPFPQAHTASGASTSRPSVFPSHAQCQCQTQKSQKPLNSTVGPLGEVSQSLYFQAQSFQALRTVKGHLVKFKARSSQKRHGPLLWSLSPSLAPSLLGWGVLSSLVWPMERLPLRSQLSSRSATLRLCEGPGQGAWLIAGDLVQWALWSSPCKVNWRQTPPHEAAETLPKLPHLSP